MKYRYRITYEGTVYADSPQEAEEEAFQDGADGCAVIVCEVEPLREANEA